MVGKVCEIEEEFDDENGVWYSIGENFFPAYAVVPVFEERETIKIGDKEYYKDEFEEAVKNLKSV